jgi:hypothetical protein
VDMIKRPPRLGSSAAPTAQHTVDVVVALAEHRVSLVNEMLTGMVEEIRRLRASGHGQQHVRSMLAVIARVPAILAGVRDIDDEQRWWLLMDVHATVADLEESGNAVTRHARRKMSPTDRTVHDRQIQRAARTALGRRLRQLAVLHPELHQRVNPAEKELAGCLANVVWQILYAPKGHSVYAELCKAFATIQLAIDARTLQNKLSAWRRDGVMAGIMRTARQ